VGERPCPTFSPQLTGSTTGYVGTSFPVLLKARSILSAIGGLRSQQSEGPVRRPRDSDPAAARYTRQTARSADVGSAEPGAS
jgi:hypothetical protein